MSTGEPAAIDGELPNSCRIYHDNGALRGVPPLTMITSALEKARCWRHRHSTPNAHPSIGATRS